MGGIVAALLSYVGLATAQQQGQHQIVENGQAFRDGPVTGAASIFVKRHVASVVQTVLLTPMLAHNGQQSGRTSLSRAQIGHAVDHFASLLLPDDDLGLAFQLEHLLGARPLAGLGQPTAGGQCPGLDAAMATIHRMGRSEIRGSGTEAGYLRFRL
jgi:hypothetical protein